ncbi:DUF6093 family protein [Kitasatospora sp. NPDC089797]|uniref:DUF6093 family protein n=1 Tax=Kitasatospora sp. NPDC089797 TaxID=3155298 RepID=UPI00343F6740
MTGQLDQVLGAGRAAHQQLMLDTCTITRSGAPVLDRNTSALTPGPATTLYAGPCRLKTQRLPRDRRAGERLAVTARYEVALPYGATTAARLQIGDTLTITSSGDTRLVGRALSIMAVDYGSTATAWRLTVEDTN